MLNKGKTPFPIYWIDFYWLFSSPSLLYIHIALDAVIDCLVTKNKEKHFVSWRRREERRVRERVACYMFVCFDIGSLFILLRHWWCWKTFPFLLIFTLGLKIVIVMCEYGKKIARNANKKERKKKTRVLIFHSGPLPMPSRREGKCFCSNILNISPWRKYS